MGVGSLRDIKVVRNGKTVSSVDIYDLLINGSRQNDIRLEEGDVILVPAYKCLVEARGKVKRPMFFEMKEGESLEALINYAGGYESNAYTQSLTVIRQNGKEYEVCSVDNNEYGTFALKNGDEVEVGELLSRFNNRVKIDGAVYRKGLYQLGGKVTTVKSLIEKAVSDYLLGLRESWESRESDSTNVRISQIESAILTVDGVMDVSNTKINGSSENLVLDYITIPVFGGVIVHV